MSHDHGPESPELKALEARLAGLRPSTGGLDRDRLLYEAGRAAALAEATARPWRLAAAALAFAAVGLGGLLAVERGRVADLQVALSNRGDAPKPEPAPTPESAPAPASDRGPILAVAPPAAPPSPSSYLALTRRLVSGTLPVPSPAAGSEPKAGPTDRNPALSPLRARGLGVEGVLEL